MVFSRDDYIQTAVMEIQAFGCRAVRNLIPLLPLFVPRILGLSQGPGGPGRGNFKYTQGVRNQQPGAPNMPPQQQQGPVPQQQIPPQAVQQVRRIEHVVAASWQNMSDW